MHKDKKNKSEKKQAASPKKLELLQRQQEDKCEEEQKSDEGPVFQECDSETAHRMIEENEGYQEFVEQLSKGSDIEMEQTMQRYLETAEGCGCYVFLSV